MDNPTLLNWGSLRLNLSPILLPLRWGLLAREELGAGDSAICSDLKVKWPLEFYLNIQRLHVGRA